MSIEKNTTNSLKHEVYGWTTILNETLQNINHTGALGVFCYLASKPENWNICKIHLSKHFNCGREHIDTCFKVLKLLGLVVTTMIRNEQGQCIGWKTLLRCKIPVENINNNQNTGNPLSGDLSRIRVSQNLGKPESGFPYTTKERTLKKKEEEKRKSVGDSPLSAHKSSTSTPKALAEKRALEDPVIRELFETKFSGLDLTIEQLFAKCQEHYDQKSAWATSTKFLQWIKTEKIENYSKSRIKTEVENRIPTKEDFDNYKNCIAGFEWVWAAMQNQKRA